MKARILVVVVLLISLASGLATRAGAQMHVVVVNPADSGPGSLRDALTQAVSGNLVVFNPSVFPPTAPVTITLTSALPVIRQGNLTIDASNAGVILDGSGIGTTPEAVLLDDISLTVDDGPNLITNGDFSGGQGHWRPWDEGPGATRGINNNVFASPPNSYEWNVVVSAGESRTLYDTTDTSEPFDDDPYFAESTVWIPVTGGSTVELRFWYEGGGVGVRLWAVFPDGVKAFFGTQYFPLEPGWTEAVFDRGLPADAVGVALELYYPHPQGWTCGLSIESNGNTVQGFQIVNFPNNGIALRNAQNTTIGGERDVGAGPLGQGNLISGNGGSGVELWGESAFNTIVGNYIGTDVYGTAALGNLNGVKIAYGPKNNTIGGDTPSEGNVISGNVENGVLIEGSDSTGNTISHNSITANGGVGIENQNGGNTELAPPVITEAVGMTVSGTACADCALEFFSDNEDEGRVFEGSTTAESDGIFTFKRAGRLTGPNVTATATDADGNTSEFSAPVPVVFQVYLPLLIRVR